MSTGSSSGGREAMATLSKAHDIDVDLRETHNLSAPLNLHTDGLEFPHQERELGTFIAPKCQNLIEGRLCFGDFEAASRVRVRVLYAEQSGCLPLPKICFVLAGIVLEENRLHQNHRDTSCRPPHRKHGRFSDHQPS